MNILVTGANGFVGSALVEHLSTMPEFQVIASMRDPEGVIDTQVKSRFIANLAPDTNWAAGLENIDCVVHTAARVHVMGEVSKKQLAEFRNINCAGTLNLARQAAEAGVKRFVFISSVKVNGEVTIPGEPLNEEVEPSPVDPYGISKREAEDGLRELAKETGLEVVIIRPPLVYGAGVKGNLVKLADLVNKRAPLPLGAIHNKRSFVALDNLVDFIIVCMTHPQAAHQTFFVSDGTDLSTTELIQHMAKAMDKSLVLLPLPESLLKMIMSVLGRREIAQRLCDSLQIDISKARKVLGWIPPIDVVEGMRRLAQGNS